MKLYVFDFGWQGSFGVFANSAEDAIEQVKVKTPERYGAGPPDEYEIKEGISFICDGDI